MKGGPWGGTPSYGKPSGFSYGGGGNTAASGNVGYMSDPRWQADNKRLGELDKMLTNAQATKFSPGQEPYWLLQAREEQSGLFADLTARGLAGTGSTVGADGVNWGDTAGTASRWRQQLESEVGGGRRSSLGTNFSSNFNLTSRDHKTYGAGDGYGFDI